MNISFNDNDTVSFREHCIFQFQPEKSRGSESDYIVLPNILVLVRRPRPAWALSLSLPPAPGQGPASRSTDQSPLLPSDSSGVSRAGPAELWHADGGAHSGDHPREKTGVGSKHRDSADQAALQGPLPGRAS